MIKVKLTNPSDEVSSAPIAPEVPAEPSKPKLKLVEPEEVTQIKVNKPIPAKVVLPINIKKTLDGNILIKDHPLIDIMVLPSANRVVTLAKDNKARDTYSAQKELFDLLRSFGLINPDSVQGSSTYGSLEATFPQSKEVDSVSAILVGIYKLLQQYQQYSKIEREYEETFENWLTDPEEGEYTDYETAMATHRVRKGSIDPKQKAFGLLFRI
jgi:hypothetical protein